MASDLLRVGTKLDIVPILSGEEDEKKPQHVYYSQIQNLKENGMLEVSMPIENQRLILLSIGTRFDLVFYTKNGTYTSVGEIKERYKADNIYLMAIELKTQLVKFQRREYFRCKCLLDLNYYKITEEQAFAEEQPIQEPAEEPGSGMAVDISGGGLRFISKVENEVGIYLYIRLPVLDEGSKKVFQIVGTILSCDKLEEQEKRYENRVQFINLPNQEREQIIRFIFNEERKARKLNRG